MELREEDWSKTLVQLRAERSMDWIRHRPAGRTTGAVGITGAPPRADDNGLIDRICAAYQRANVTDLGDGASFWLTTMFDLKRPIHDALLARDMRRVGPAFRDPKTSTLFFGYDNLNSEEAQHDSPGFVEFQRQWTYDNLLRLAEAVGVADLEWPEAPPKADPPPPEDILRRLDELFGFMVDFPNPFESEFGLATNRGVASYRSVQALYQAWLAKRLSAGGSVVEIGGGLGRTAYYAKKFGIREYTIIDIPMTGAAQAYFLERAGVSVKMFGEEGNAQVSILPPTWFFQTSERYGLLMNVDSFTEMSPATATRYIETGSERAKTLLSINHEYNSFKVGALLADLPRAKCLTRDPYWLRRGYVKEVAKF
jgi:hypothetical protein